MISRHKNSKHTYKIKNTSKSYRRTGSNHLEASARNQIWSKRRLRIPAAMTLSLRDSRPWGLKTWKERLRIMRRDSKRRRKVAEISGTRAEGPMQRRSTNFRATFMKGCLILGWCHWSFICRKSLTISRGLQAKDSMALSVNYIRRKRRGESRPLFKRWRMPFVLAGILIQLEISPQGSRFIKEAQPKPHKDRGPTQMWAGLIAKWCTITNTFPSLVPRALKSATTERRYISPRRCF